ncbi:MAG: DUF3800 domain-containing protein [Nocardioidaceae bacterium]
MCAEVRSSAQVVEIACDESGSEGEKLIGGTTDVFAHASLDLDTDAAAACVEQVRVGARSPATEVKASVVLREQNRWLLEWLIGSTGPLQGNAHVYLTEKRFQLVRKVIEVLDVGADPAAGTSACERERHVDGQALALHDAGPRLLGPAWQGFLMSFNDLMRARTPPDARAAARSCRDLVTRPVRGHPRAGADDILGVLRDALPTCDAGLARLFDRMRRVGTLDPLVPAIARAVWHWGSGRRSVAVVHDVQAALTPQRIAQVHQICDHACVPASQACVNKGLADIRFVDSQHDPRVQVADFLAGAARRIAEAVLNDAGDPALVALVRPYVDSCSIWADGASWAELAPAHSAQ